MRRQRTLLTAGTGPVMALVVVAVPRSSASLTPAVKAAAGSHCRRCRPRAVRATRIASTRSTSTQPLGVAFIQARIVEHQTSPFGFPQRQQGIATGTGFVLDKDGYIVTNAHVVEHASDVVVRFKEGHAVPAKIVGSDLSNDIALLKVDPSQTELKPLQLGDSREGQVGEPVVAIGNPFGLADTITAGIVSAKQRYIQALNGFTIEHVIQTDAAVNPATPAAL